MSSRDSPISPRLPRELEHAIFVLAYEDDSESGRNDLILVAKRVFDWLIPHIYHVVTLSNRLADRTESSEAIYRKYGYHTRYLWIDSNEWRESLTLFPNVINLAFWVDYDPIYLPHLLQLPLTYISARPRPDLFQIFANVTHLDIMASFGSDSLDARSTLFLPKLTHLCLTGMKKLPLEEFEVFLDRGRCPELRVVILWDLGHDKPKLSTHDRDVDDKRVVVVACDAILDWERTTRGEMDMWRFAEGVVASRG